MRNNVSEPLDRACAGRVLPERNMRSHLIMIDGIFRMDSAKVLRVHRTDPIKRSSYPFCQGERNEVVRSRMPIARTRARHLGLLRDRSPLGEPFRRPRAVGV